MLTMLVPQPLRRQLKPIQRNFVGTLSAYSPLGLEGAGAIVKFLDGGEPRLTMARLTATRW
eukprot:1201354-Amphidinium_carterae.1